MTASVLAEQRLGAELPQIIREPPDIASYDVGLDTIELANSYQICDGNPLAPSQELRLRNGMAKRADGSWAAKRVGDFGGRQGAGKTQTVIARILGGIFLVDEKLTIYTAHEYPTANEIFIRFGQLFEAWDDLSSLVLSEKRAHGDQGYELKGPKGSEITGKRRLLFKTRTGKSGRGFAKADLLIYDESQHLLAEHVAGSGPAKLANPQSQSWWSGSGGLSTSAKAWEMRLQALLGTGGRLAYTEHTAELFEIQNGEVTFSQPDIDDRDGWFRANPGLGRWVTEEDMADLILELGVLAGRECLCVWEPEPSTGGNVIDAALWNNLAETASKAETHHSWALSVSPDRKWASIGIAGRRADGHIHVEWQHHEPGTAWIVEACLAMYRKRRIPLRVAANSAEASLIEDITDAGVEVVEVSTTDVARATGEFIDAANNYRLRHLGQRSLDKAVGAAVLKTTEAGASVWAERSSDIEITPLKAVTVALGGVTEQKDRSAVNNVW